MGRGDVGVGQIVCGLTQCLHSLLFFVLTYRDAVQAVDATFNPLNKMYVALSIGGLAVPTGRVVDDTVELPTHMSRRLLTFGDPYLLLFVYVVI